MKFTIKGNIQTSVLMSKKTYSRICYGKDIPKHNIEKLINKIKKTFRLKIKSKLDKKDECYSHIICLHINFVYLNTYLCIYHMKLYNLFFCNCIEGNRTGCDEFLLSKHSTLHL